MFKIKWFESLGLVCLWLMTTFLAAEEAKPVQVESGFVSIFNGQDLAGWEGDFSLWKVRAGKIVGDSPGIKHNNFLATTSTYKNFELRLQFRLSNGVGNSGIQFRSQRVPNNHEVEGYQADIGEEYWGCLYDEHRRRKILAQAPSELSQHLHKSGWNEYSIKADGNKITLKVNNFTTVQYLEEDNTIAPEGIIALQVHSGKPLKVEFRNLRIKELK